MSVMSTIKTGVKHLLGRSLTAQRRPHLKLLSGCGLEIGALHRPVTAPHLTIQYVDLYTREELYTIYPELQGLPLVKTDIVSDAETLRGIESSSQDFIIANHVIEHMANPIGALRAWMRVLRPGGKLYLAVPDKEHTFDRERECTTIAHLLEDFESPSRERDSVHFEEFALHVSCRTCHLCSEEDYRSYAQKLWEENYSIHYHVWDFSSFRSLLTFLGSHFDDWQFRIIAERKTVTDEFGFVLVKE